MNFVRLIPALVLLLVSTCYAQTDIATVKKGIAEKFPEAGSNIEVTKTTFGWYKVYAGGRLFYTDEDVNYFFLGNIVEAKSMSNITAKEKAISRAETIVELEKQAERSNTPGLPVTPTVAPALPHAQSPCASSVQWLAPRGNRAIQTFTYSGGDSATVRNEESGATAQFRLDQIQGTYTGTDNWVDVERWAECHLKSQKDRGNGAADSNSLDIVTPQVPGCPKYLRKSLVTWHQVGNPQLNTWEIRNISNKLLKVTFNDDGINRDSPTLNPGGSAQIGITGQRVPRYVVRDFEELLKFNRTPEARSGKTLQCELAIRPR